MEWNLSVIYPSFESAAFQDDLASIKGQVDQLMATLSSDLNEIALIETALTRYSNAYDTFSKLMNYAQLTLSTDAANEQAAAALDKLLALAVSFEQSGSALSRYIGKTDDLNALIDTSLILKANHFFLQCAHDDAAHQLDTAIEPWMLTMSLSGSEAFSQLRDKLNATHTVPFRGEELPLSAIRAKAYEPDAAVRKEAYEAEIASYAKMELPMAYCLNSIKAEADTYSKAKHFDSILDMTLYDSRMDRQTLDAMWTTIKEYLPDFRRYLKAKAKLLKHSGGLPFYDLFAPVGSESKTYTVDEAKAILIKAFTQFNPAMADFIQNAFDDSWIDMFPHPGKSGGAFCSSIHCLGISRILTNFTGSFSDISTLAHELGHAWHNHCMKGLPSLMTDYPMPLAETASIFNETMLTHQVLKDASDDMAFTLLEAELMEATQTVVDIYSRYLFEADVIQTRKDHTLSPAELKDAMLKAQDASYGDGLDPDVRHPYMWACKSHYYSKDYNFYNFPYAFGLLFGKGVFAKYLEKGESFIPEYNRMLSICGSDTVLNVAASVGIDVRSVDFWRSSLDVIRQSIGQFVAICETK